LVSELAITGASPDLETLIYNLLQTKPGRTSTRSQLQEDVNAIYASGYFSNVKVVPEDTPLGVKVTFVVEQNPILNAVQIEAVPSKNQTQALPQNIIQSIFSDQYGKTLNLRNLQGGIKQLNEWYAKNGYDLAQIVGAPKVGGDGVVTLVIAEGLVQDIKVRFFDAEEAPVQGKTRDFIVTREMKLKPGDIFNRNTVQADLRRVFGLGLFEDVRLSFTPGEDPREVIVNVDVVEGNTGSIAAGAGISSNSGIFGTLSYQEKNLGGNNQTIGGELQVGQRELLFDVNFTDPWIAGDPFRTSYTVNGFRRQTTSLVYDTDQASIRTLNCDGILSDACTDNPRVVRTGLGVTFVRPLADDVFTKPDWLVSAGFVYQHVQITNSNGNISPLSAPLNGYPSQYLAFSPSGIDDLVILSLGASQDFRNNPLQPTSGSLLRLGMEQSAPLGSGNILFNRIRGSYSYYIPLSFLDFGFIEDDQPRPQTLAFNFQAGTVLGDLPPYEAFVVGGSNSVRGYAEGEVGSGRSFFQATAEYRFPIISAVGGAFFVDFGTLLSSDGAVPGTPSRILGLPGNGTGYGLGVRIQSPVGPIRVDFGFKATGGSRLSFGIGERF
jgi:outer membrane protein insertion porin family